MFAEWQEYATDEYDEEEEDPSYEGYERTAGVWVHPTKGPYVEEYEEYAEEDDGGKIGTATPDSLGLGPEHHKIYTPEAGNWRPS